MKGVLASNTKNRKEMKSAPIRYETSCNLLTDSIKPSTNSTEEGTLVWGADGTHGG